MSEPRRPSRPSDVARLYTDMPVFDLGSKHPASGALDQQGDDEIGWDRASLSSSFTSIHADPSTAADRARESLIAEGWTVSSAIDTTGPAQTFSATRTMSRAAQLKPSDENARRLLGYWSLKDAYPPGIARGGCIMVNYDYKLTVIVRPAGEYTDAELSAVATSPAVGGCRIETSCAEVISPFKGRFPDPRRFSISSELNRVDPVPALKEALGEQAQTEPPTERGQ